MIARRYPLVSFVVLACAFGWSPYLVAFLTGGSGAENNPLGPLAAALVVVSCQGWEALKGWGRTVRNWRAAPRLYALAVLAPLAVQLLIVAANSAFGAPLPSSGQLAEWPQAVVGFVIMLVFVGIGEEAAWMAFAAPVLLQRHGLLVAWVFAAGMRILWHLPLMLAGDLGWVLGTIGNAAFTMVALQLLITRGGRWSLVAVWHATLNAVGSVYFFTMVTGEDKARLGFLLALAYAVVAVALLLHGNRRHSTECAPDDAAPVRETTGAAHGA
jgi:membrane protease YdiL (CAAX protease family)